MASLYHGIKVNVTVDEKEVPVTIKTKASFYSRTGSAGVDQMYFPVVPGGVAYETSGTLGAALEKRKADTEVGAILGPLIQLLQVNRHFLDEKCESPFARALKAFDADQQAMIVAVITDRPDNSAKIGKNVTYTDSSHLPHFVRAAIADDHAQVKVPNGNYRVMDTTVATTFISFAAIAAAELDHEIRQQKVPDLPIFKNILAGFGLRERAPEAEPAVKPRPAPVSVTS